MISRSFENEDGKLTCHITDDSKTLSEEDFQAYWETLINGPFEVHLDRERKRLALWKQYSAEDQARQIKIKGDRVMHTFESFGEFLQDDVETRTAVEAEIDDIINYCIFAKRLLAGQV